MKDKLTQGLTRQLKDQLIRQSLARRSRKLHQANATEAGSGDAPARGKAVSGMSDGVDRFDKHPGFTQLQILSEGARKMGIESPFFRVHDGLAGRATEIGGKRYLNFANYNYLGLCGHPEVDAAAKEAIDRYGTSVSASRPVSGERALHRDLESALAELHGVDDAIAFVSGHATNVTTIGYLFGQRDLIVHDALIHNSALLGAQLSGATRRSFPHNDLDALDQMLATQRGRYERVLIVVEGIYSMDGDYPNLPRLVEIKRRHRAFLMVDDAHSLGVMGATGLGIREHFGLDGDAADIWMGTLSKSLASCGGYIAGSRALVEHLKFAGPGFLYSVGMAPPVAAAARAALELMRREPERVRHLQAVGQRFLEKTRSVGIDTGTSTGLAIVPAITGSSMRAVRLANRMFDNGVNVQPIVYPAVGEKAARLRFFLSAEHTEEDIDKTVDCLAQAW